MLLLFLSAVIYSDFIKCNGLETANSNKSLRSHQEHEVTRYENIITYHNISTTPFGNKTHDPSSPPSVPGPFSPFSKDSKKPIFPKLTLEPSQISTPVSIPSTPSNLPKEYKYPTYKESTPNTTSPSSPDVKTAVYLTIYPPGFGSNSITVSTVTTVGPSVADFAKKRLQEVASSTTSSPKLLVPKLSQIFDYGYSSDGFLSPIRRNQRTTQQRTSFLKNDTHKHQTRPNRRQGVTVPQITNKRNSGSIDDTFWHDPAETKTLSVHRTGHSQIPETVTKHRLKPGLLLGKASIGNVTWNPEDVEESKETTPGSDDSKKALRMYYIPAKNTNAQLEPRPANSYLQFVRHTLFPTLKISTTRSEKMNVVYHKTYMIMFVVELTRLIATKEEEAVHDVVKHTDHVIHNFHKNEPLHWFFQPLLNIIKKVAAMLKKTKTSVIQNYAANLHETLKQRQQTLPEEVNSILDKADRLYDEEDGELLQEGLREFTVYPNITLSGYWLCNSMINNFLRPFRRLTDSKQRQHLVDSVKQALKTVFASKKNVTTTENWLSDGLESPTPTKPVCVTPSHKRHRKRKRHHRHGKRKRQRKRHRLPECSFKDAS